MLSIYKWIHSIFMSDSRIQALESQEKAKNFQKALLYIWITLGVFSVVYFLSGAFFIAGLLVTGTLLLTTLNYFIERRGYHDEARYFLIVCANLYICGTKLGSNNLIATEIWYFSLCLVTLFFFEYNKTRQIQIGIVISFLSWLISRKLNPEMIPANLRQFNSISPYWNDLNFGANFIFNLACLRQLYFSNQKYQNYSMLKSKFATLGELAAGIVHEINNSLTVIQAKTSLLHLRISKEDPQFTKYMDELEKIERTTQQIIKISNGVRAFARQSQSDPLVRSSFQEIFTSTLDICRYKLERQNIDLQIPTGISEDLYCRPYQIVQVLLNLINNACDAIQMLPYPWIHIQLRSTSEFVIISVMDSGPGIPSEIVDQMMNPFFSKKPLSQGTGLGLCICHRIMDEHHGKIEYSHLRGNTEFILTFPKT